jgi:hypothetical protein
MPYADPEKRAACHREKSRRYDQSEKGRETRAAYLAGESHRGRNWHAAKTHCVHGHEFTPENTHRDANGHRSCRACIVARSARYRAGRTTWRPGQKKAWSRVSLARLQGRIIAEPCAECGAEPAQAHHPNGYEGDAMYDIVWLCSKHHRAAHRRAA